MKNILETLVSLLFILFIGAIVFGFYEMENSRNRQKEQIKEDIKTLGKEAYELDLGLEANPYKEHYPEESHIWIEGYKESKKNDK